MQIIQIAICIILIELIRQALMRVTVEADDGKES